MEKHNILFFLAFSIVVINVLLTSASSEHIYRKKVKKDRFEPERFLDEEVKDRKSRIDYDDETQDLQKSSTGGSSTIGGSSSNGCSSNIGQQFMSMFDDRYKVFLYFILPGIIIGIAILVKIIVFGTSKTPTFTAPLFDTESTSYSYPSTVSYNYGSPSRNSYSRAGQVFPQSQILERTKTITNQIEQAEQKYGDTAINNPNPSPSTTT